VGCSATCSTGSDVEAISELEVPEILSLLPDFAGKDILELGAGAGF